MCTDEDDEVFDCEDTPTTGDDNNKRPSQSTSSLNSPASTTEKVSSHRKYIQFDNIFL